MRAVRVIIILFAILAIATGGMDVLVGTAGQANIGLDRSVIEHFDCSATITESGRRQL